MVTVLLERHYNPPLSPQPMTTECWHKRHETYEPCLEARDIKGVHSFVALDGTRSICVLEASYAEAVREATREAKVPFRRIWRAEISSSLGDDKIITCSSPVVVEVSYPNSMTKEQWEQFQPDLQGLDICHLTGYLASTGEHAVDIFAAANADIIRNLYWQLDIKLDCVWQSSLLI